MNLQYSFYKLCDSWKSQESPEAAVSTGTRRVMRRHEESANGKSNGPLSPPDDFHDPASPKSEDNYVETDHDGEPDGPLDRSNWRRKGPRRYSEDILGVVVYDDEYLKTCKSESASSGSEGDEEYKLDDEEDEENPEEDDYVEEEEDSIGSSEEEVEKNQRLRRHKKESAMPKWGARKLRSFNDIGTGLSEEKYVEMVALDEQKQESLEKERSPIEEKEICPLEGSWT